MRVSQIGCTHWAPNLLRAFSSLPDADVLRTEPAGNAAPDISVQILSTSLSDEQAGRNVVPLMQAAAKEVWTVHPDGTLIKHKQRDLDFMLPDLPISLPVDRLEF
jgi:hypothetical protein